MAGAPDLATAKASERVARLSPPLFLHAAVTAGAVFGEHGLHVALKIERPRRNVGQGDKQRRENNGPQTGETWGNRDRFHWVRAPAL